MALTIATGFVVDDAVVVVESTRTAFRVTRVPFAGADGAFRASVPPGTYSLSGTSPKVLSDDKEMQCLAARPVAVRPGSTKGACASSATSDESARASQPCP